MEGVGTNVSDFPPLAKWDTYKPKVEINARGRFEQGDEIEFIFIN